MIFKLFVCLMYNVSPFNKQEIFTMLSSRQISAACGLLRISNKELGRQIKIHPNSINNIHRANHTTSVEILYRVESFLASKGITFIGNRMISDLLVNDTEPDDLSISTIETALVDLLETVRMTHDKFNN
jgi:hypothetical protein